MQPVRREILEAVAAYSMKELEIISPDGYVAYQKSPDPTTTRKLDQPKGI